MGQTPNRGLAGPQIEDWLGLSLNKEKTKVVQLKRGDCLDFLGYSFRFDRDLMGRDYSYLNVLPSKKSMKRARAVIKEKTGPRMCFKPAGEVAKDINIFLAGWSHYFGYGYPRKAFHDISNYARCRMMIHLNRRSQRKSHRPKGMSWYQYLKLLGLKQL